MSVPNASGGVREESKHSKEEILKQMGGCPMSKSFSTMNEVERKEMLSSYDKMKGLHPI